MRWAGIAFLLLAAISPAQGVEVAGVEIPDSLSAGKAVLSLNGAGVRTKTFIRIKVYVGALYLEAKSGDGPGIVAADEPQAVLMSFIYDGVSSEKLIASWNEGFEESTDGNTAGLKEQISAFNAFFTEEAKAGDIYQFVYLPREGVKVTIKGAVKGIIPGLAFKQALWGIWLGADPVDDDLKEEMLGETP